MEQDVWLSEVVGIPCYTIKSSDEGLFDELKGHQSRCFLQSKVAAHNSEMVVRLISELDMYLVDTSIELMLKKPCIELIQNAPGETIRHSRPADLEALKRLAGAALQHNRFYFDPQFPNKFAREIKEKWVSAYCEGRINGKVFVATVGSSLIGFVAVKPISSDIGRVDLVAVEPPARGTGVARRLILDALSRLGLKGLEVGTSINNRGALRSYLCLGFAPFNTVHLLHGHR